MTETTKSKRLARLQALEAVAEAARTYVAKHGMSPTWPDLIAAVAALDALPADPEPAPAEVVEVAVWVETGPGSEYRLVPPDSRMNETFSRAGGYRRLGTTRLPLVKRDGA